MTYDEIERDVRAINLGKCVCFPELDVLGICGAHQAILDSTVALVSQAYKEAAMHPVKRPARRHRQEEDSWDGGFSEGVLAMRRAALALKDSLVTESVAS